jgi:hypothetical protein
LFTKKLKVFTPDDLPDFSPFIRNITLFGLENYEVFQINTQVFWNQITNRWQLVLRINDLWINRKADLVIKELNNYFESSGYLIDNSNAYQFVYKVNNQIFSPVHNNTDYKKKIRSGLCYIKNTNAAGFEELFDFFSGSSLFYNYDKKFNSLFNDFVSIFPYLIPVFGLKFYDGDVNRMLCEYGITTLSIEDIKSFYIDLYETLTEMLSLVVALNNLMHRNDYRLMVSNPKQISDFSNFISLTKGNKKKFINSNEFFDCTFLDNLESNIRNAFGHNDYEFRGATQEIIYNSSGNLNDRREQSMFLAELCYNTLNMFLSLLNLYFLVYYVRRTKCAVTNGLSSHVNELDLEDSSEKAGRNDKCPCGSGEKYKNCCG